MICVTLKEAKARLNGLVEKAGKGESVVLMRGSKHVATIVPITDDDLSLSPELSDAQATRLWQEIESQREAGRLKKLAAPRDILS